MSKEDIDKAVKEAEQFAAEDKARREAVDAKNEAENMAYQAEKLVADNGDKLSEDDKNALTTKAQAVKEAISKDDKALIDAAKDDLQKTLYDISSRMYQAAQAAGAAPGADPTGGQAPEGNVYDADFTDVDGQ